MNEAERDSRWWEEKLPPGWNLASFDYRNTARVVGPTGQVVTLNGTFMQALFDKMVLRENKP